MDLIGGIVEKNPAPPNESDFETFNKSTSNLKVNRKPSKWKQRLEKKNIKSISFDAESKHQKEIEELDSAKELSEKEKIHLENLKYFASMSPDDFAREQEELFSSLDPKILQALMKKQQRGDEYLKSKDSNNEAKAEQNQQKVKNKKTESIRTKGKELKIPEEQMPSKDSKVEDNERLQDEKIPSSEQLLQFDKQTKEEIFSSIHFPTNPKPSKEEDYKLDINDPGFLDQLHEKYFPDLPKDAEKLKWAQPIVEKKDPLIVTEIDNLRFDFSGDIVNPDPPRKIPANSGLYHHESNPELPGYTLKELSRLAMSAFNSQRCIAIRTLGRVLYKLGMHRFNIVIDDLQDTNHTQNSTNPEIRKEFEYLLWNQLDQLQVVPILINSADEKLTRNLSVRTYAIEALWLWKQCGGDRAMEKEDLSDYIAH